MRKKREPLTPEQKKKRLKRRLIVYSAIILALFGVYKFQPIEIEFFPREAPAYKKVDPDTAKLYAKGTRVLVITAHPDDSEFYSGGFLPRLRDSGAEIAHLLHTDGDKAYYFWTDNSSLREIRRKEQTTASTQWGANSIWFLGYPDGRLRNNQETIAKTVAKIQEWKPDYILCFDPDFGPARSHQDHRRSGEISLAAAREAGFKGWLLMFSSRAPNFIVDIDKYWSEKLELLAIHKSQFEGAKLKWIQDFRADAAAKDGTREGYSFGEGYRAVKF